jgi:putative lipoprotein
MTRRPMPAASARRWRALGGAPSFVGAGCAALLLLAPAVGRADPPAADPDPWLGPDKALHFGVSAAIAGGGYALAAPFFDDYGARAGLGAGLALSAGMTKEALDAAGLGHPSWRDVAWDVLGTAVGIGISLTIDYAVRGGESSERARP